MTVATPFVYPTLPSLMLDDEERYVVDKLQRRLLEQQPYLNTLNAYYEGENIVSSLGISIPPELEGLHTVIGWPRTAVDALDERLDIVGFRYPDSLDADDDLWGMWQANNLDSEAPLGNLESMIFGHSFICVGAGNCGPGKGPDGCPPLITVESPLHMACVWDPQARHVSAAFKSWEFEGEWRATLYMDGRTIQLAKADGGWQIVDRDDHGFPVPVIRIANRERVSEREGRSEITPELMSITDAACRTLLGMEVNREFYSAPQKYILGISEDAFVKSDGSAATGWESYLGRIMALDRDEDGQTPTVGQFTPGDPSVYTKIIDSYAKIIGGITGLPPEFLGQSNNNPASADAIRSAQDRLVRKAKRKAIAFGAGWEDAMRLALLIRDGTLPDNSSRLETIWARVESATPAADADSAFKKVQVGILPASSKVLLTELGYSPLDQERIAQERKRDQGTMQLAQLASAIQSRQARTDLSVEKDIQGPTTPTDGKPNTSPAPSS